MIDWESLPLRSLLFAPGSDEPKLAKLGTFGADAVVLDLEDAVADREKVVARAKVRHAIPTYGDATAVIVRVNGAKTGLMVDDVAAVVTEGIDAIMVPKVEDAQALQQVDAALSDAERTAGMRAGAVRLFAVVESPLGLVRCESILAEAPRRVHTALLGSGDYTAALGVDLTVDATEILYARSRLVAATRAAGLVAPIDGVWLHLDDNDGLVADSALGRQLGFQGRAIVYPPQIEPAHRAYSVLTDEEVTLARQIVEAFQEAEAQGVASLRVGGRFVDYPIYRLAKERLLRYDTWLTDSADIR